MIKIHQLKVPVLSEEPVIIKKAAKILGIKEQEILHTEILRHSIDARKEAVYDIYQLACEVKRQDLVLKRKSKDYSLYQPVEYDFFARRNKISRERKKLKTSPVIIGAGPAGYFCAWMLAKHGYSPVLLERGKAVEEREKDVTEFFEGGRLFKNSNVQFGEGGAGAFSDGKLNTLVKDKEGRSKEVLKTFVKCGAPEDILYESKPHIGTDVLHQVLIKMRQQLLEFGCEIHFNSTVTQFRIENEKITGVITEDGTVYDTDVVVLAIGHSARDTFQTLFDQKVDMEAKSFAVGFRVEHPQKQINEVQYGKELGERMAAAPYKVTAKAGNGRGVYSFCMCPGGFVVNASSEQMRTAVNGMSYRARDSKNANSAVIVSVGPKDYPSASPLSGVEFQENLEKKAYELGKGRIPQQLFIDFENNVASTDYGDFTSETKGDRVLTNLRGVFPLEVEDAFVEGMHSIGKKFTGFDRKDAILSAVESRTSSPVRIPRNEVMESNIKGLYPCGEGAGYAGGIMSAAMDGLKVAEMIAAEYDR
ncbi:MAG: FAD-dependent oxidoreductase [Lachnospiraceae bacterium]|nr:FAD-dependent oxidoreductase [Lachnospiraceae bacterium]